MTPPVTTDIVQPFYKGEQPLVALTPGIQGQGGLLRVGQSIASVVWNPEAPMAIMGGTSAVVTTIQTDDTTQVQIDLTDNSITDGSRYTLEAVWTMQNPTEVRTGYMVIQIKKKPE